MNFPVRSPWERFCSRTRPNNNQMLKTPAGKARIFLLRIFNKIWMEHTFPRTWREAIIIPIPKDGKDRTKPSTYRPISLTSCICNFWERMVIRVWSGTWSRETYLHPSNVVSGRTGQPWTTLSPSPHRSPLLSCYVNTW